jgi:oligopeptide/dipeptide ABC transporter ATP-binding protein
MTEAQPLLSVRDLRKHFPVRRGFLSRTAGVVKAVDGVSFDIHPGETLGLVGESGCGKTTVGRSILRLTEPTSGQVLYQGRDLARFRREELRRVRAEVQIIFQDPFSSLDPRQSVGQIVAEPLHNHLHLTKAEAHDRVAELLLKVGLTSDCVRRYPHEFSGGQRQRIGLARSLALNPRLIVCDEPVSALDVSIQAQVINLLLRLQAELGLSYLFIAHDLAVVEHISDRVAVMYLGRVVELAYDRELYQRPLHPYTQALLSAVPVADPEAQSRRILLSGDPPSPLRPPAGCAFHPRCQSRLENCDQAAPTLTDQGQGHWVACHLWK